MEHRGRGRGGRGAARGGDRGRGRGRGGGGGRGGGAGRGRGGGGGGGGGSRGGRGGYGGAAIKGTESWRGKAQKIKAKMVHKFKVKKEFYRDVKKEGLDETPEFYKEIFGESQDNDDQTHESDSDSAERSKGSRGVKRKVHDSNNEGESDVTDDEEENVKDGVEKEYDLGAESSDDDEEEKNVRGKGTALKEKHSMVKGAKEKPTKRPRFNPYAKLLKQREEDKKEREKAVEQAKKEREVREKGRKAYYDSRETERRRLTQKTSRGQPVMRNQVKHLLAKIKKMDEV